MPYNLASPNSIVSPCKLSDLDAWFLREIARLESPAQRTVLKQVAANLKVFVRCPKQALLLWVGCTRVPEVGKKQKYHSYPDRIRRMANAMGLRLDRRPNGPAIAAFQLAGGERPKRFGSRNAWSIHHLYSGKFPYYGRDASFHAVKHGNHFTQSAGLVALHPIADALVDEFPPFAWLLRAKCFLRFGYDPDGVFSRKRNPYGFRRGRRCKIIVAAGKHKHTR